MTRAKMIQKLAKMAATLAKAGDPELNKEMWSACARWNCRHSGQEIFLTEVYDEDDEPCGVAVEDEVFYFNR